MCVCVHTSVCARLRVGPCVGVPLCVAERVGSGYCQREASSVKQRGQQHQAVLCLISSQNPKSNRDKLTRTKNKGYGSAGLNSLVYLDTSYHSDLKIIPIDNFRSTVYMGRDLIRSGVYMCRDTCVSRRLLLFTVFTQHQDGDLPAVQPSSCCYCVAVSRAA